MSVNAFVQFSAGRFPVTLNTSDTLHQVRTKIRNEIRSVNHVNFKDFRFVLNGTFLTDDSATVGATGVTEGDTLILVKRSACLKAGIDTEKRPDE